MSLRVLEESQDEPCDRSAEDHDEGVEDDSNGES